MAEGNCTMSTPAQMRKPLQDLPAIPLNKRPTPIRLLSSPPKITSVNTKPDTPKDFVLLTPPITPLRPEDRIKAANLDSLNFNSLATSEDSGITKAEQNAPAKESKEVSWEDTIPKVYTGEYRALGSGPSNREEYGRGVWSMVYSAVEVTDKEAASSPSMLTPPTSPVAGSSTSRATKTLAIKAPIRRDANKVLENEARILSYLHQNPTAAEHVVLFHGYNESEHALVLDAIPLSLDTSIKLHAKFARSNVSTKTMFEPIIGLDQWLSLAKGLVTGLAYLHSQNCVHGDIKPGNVLLQSATTDSSSAPLYCDFSSSHIFHPDRVAEEVGAVTTEYSSPELLESFYRRNGQRAVATLASDVFALGVTLLVAATGESPYASARMEIQKIAMAREGRPLDFARNGDQASRIMKGKIVDKLLRAALEKDLGKRCTAEDWRLTLEQELKALMG